MSTKINGITVGTPAPVATNERLGTVKGTPDGDYGIMISGNGEVQVRRATTADINARKHTSRPIVPANLKQAVTSVFEDVYSEVYVQTGKLRSAVIEVMASLNPWFRDGDVWGYDDGTDVSVSEDNLHNVKGEFVGQIIHVGKPNEPVYAVYMYLGQDANSQHVWAKLGEVTD